MEVQGDQHFDPTTMLFNLKTQNKLEILKELSKDQYEKVAWVNKKFVQQLSKVQNNSEKIQLFWEELGKNQV